jgi:Holliday junction resolvasome RuvABC endonuclease subunit
MCLPDGRVGTVKTSPHERGGLYALETRCFQIRDKVIDRINRASGLRVLCVIEDLPQARAEAIGQLGVMHGVVRAGLLAEGIDFAVPTVGAVKKFATGKGNAPKPTLRVELVRRSKGAIDIVDDNQVDAWWLHEMGLHALGGGTFELPALRLEALAKIAWPAFPDSD